MLASEFINTMSFGLVMGASHFGNTNQSLEETYNKEFFLIPRIYCKDGFNISVQVHNGSYSASENGKREFGLNWVIVEWGFPSMEIDAIKYNADLMDDETTTGCIGICEVSLIDNLCDEHGGIDLQKTLETKLLETKAYC